jgi:8-oxo-dGTP pyrophosphatase MutT (NUDIX family)
MSTTERPRFLVHVSVAVMDGNKVLMVEEEKEASRNKWNLPGGHVDYDEPLPLAAQRELREETGLDLPLSARRRDLIFHSRDSSGFTAEINRSGSCFERSRIRSRSRRRGMKFWPWRTCR